MDCSWNNPQQYRAAFDFLGALAPAADFRKIDHAGNNTNPYVIDDFNYLPYFQGISAEFICLKQDGNVWGDGSQGWTDISHAYMDSSGGNGATTAGDYYRDKPFFPRFLKKIFVYAHSAGQFLI